MQCNITSTLIIILVAKRTTIDNHAAHGIDNTANRDVRAKTAQHNHRAQRQRVAKVVVSIDRRDARGVHVLPDTVGVIDERVVHPEDGVAGTGRDVGHHSSDAVVAVCVRTIGFVSTWDDRAKEKVSDLPSFQTAFHTRVIASRITRIDKPAIALRSQALIHRSAQTMRRIATPRPNMTCESCKRTADNTDWIPIRIRAWQVPEIIRIGEQITAMEIPCIERLIPPWQRRCESTLIS